MADPLSLLPFALAAGGGSIDGVECRQLVAAGLALRPRSARLARTLVRASAFLRLHPGAAALTAIAACDGLPLTLLDPDAVDELAPALAAGPESTSVVFTSRALASDLPTETITVLLDDAPASVTVRHRDDEQRVDLGSHFAMDIAGERDVEGHADVVLMEPLPHGGTRAWTHRALLQAIRETAIRDGRTPRQVYTATDSWHIVDHFIAAAATLYVGGRVETTRRSGDV